MLAENWNDCVEIARAQTRDGAHLLDVCIDYVGRDGVADMRAIASRFATASTLPLVLDSTEPAVVEAGLECLGGRAVVNSVNYEDGDGPGSRIEQHDAARPRARGGRHRAHDRRGGPGPNRRVEGPGRRPADPRPHRQVGHEGPGHPGRLPDLPDRHRAGGDPPRRPRDDRGDPRGQAPVPRGADHARRLQRLVRAEPRRADGAQLRVPARVHERRSGLRDRALGQDPPDGADPGRAARGGARPGVRPAAPGHRHRARVRPAVALPRPVRRRRRRERAGHRARTSWRRCRWPSDSSGGSSTASATGSRPTSTRRCGPARRWRSSTTRCSTA